MKRTHYWSQIYLAIWPDAQEHELSETLSLARQFDGDTGSMGREELKRLALAWGQVFRLHAA